MLLRPETILHSSPLEINMLQTHEFFRLTKLFESVGMPVLSLKGVLMAFDLYGDIGARSSKDIDLLIRGLDVPEADKLLVAQGYVRQRLTARQLASHRIHGKDFVYWHPKKRICVELHWRLFQDWDCFNPFEVPYQEIILGSQSFKTLSSEYNLLYLATHGCESGWARPQWSQDIKMLLKKYGEQLDWGLIWREAERYDLTGPLEQALCNAGELSSGKGLLSAGRSHNVRQYVWRPGAWLAKIMLRKRWGNRLKAAWSLLVPRAQDFQALNLPDWLFFLYPLARPFLALARNRQRSKESSHRP